MFTCTRRPPSGSLLGVARAPKSCNSGTMVIRVRVRLHNGGKLSLQHQVTIIICYRLYVEWTHQGLPFLLLLQSLPSSDLCSVWWKLGWNSYRIQFSANCSFSLLHLPFLYPPYCSSLFPFILLPLMAWLTDHWLPSNSSLFLMESATNRSTAKSCCSRSVGMTGEGCILGRIIVFY